MGQVLALPKKNRLRTKKEIDRVFKNGRTVRGSFLFIRFLRNQKGSSRFAFIVPTKHIPLAVDRNKIKRMLSEEVMSSFLSRQGYDVIVVITGKVERIQLKRLSTETREILEKLI